MSDVVIHWDVQDGNILGAIIRCPECPECYTPGEIEGSGGTGCEGRGVLFRPYRLHGRDIDLNRDAEILIQLLDREDIQPQSE